MELTINQALQKGIEAHKAGRVQEAYRLYTAILKAHPKHPDANHNMGVLAVGVGRVQEALQFLKTALEANSSAAQYWLSYIDALIEVGEAKAATRYLKAAEDKLGGLEAFKDLALKNNKRTNYDLDLNIDQLFKRAIKFKKSENFSDAILTLENILKNDPNNARYLKSLAECYQKLNNTEGVINSYKKLLKVKSDDAQIFYNLALALRRKGDTKGAITNYKKSIKIKPDFAAAYYNLANIFKSIGYLAEAIVSYQKAIEINPYYSEASKNLNLAKAQAVPAWHTSMINDQARNKAFSKALELAVDEMTHVLEIGTGSGLLSMMAARFGARNIITCEVDKSIATVAEKIIQQNGYKDNITVLNKNSKELVLGNDLPNKADLIVSEIFAAEFVGEGVRSTFLDATKRLLNPNGRMIPESGNIVISLLEGNAEILDKVSVANIHGFDLSQFNDVVPRKFTLRLENPTLLSSPKDAFEIDCYDQEDFTRLDKTIRLKANRKGLCIGLIQWLKINLYKDIVYENDPTKQYSHWGTPIYLFDTPIEVNRGQVLKIRAMLEQDSVWFYHLT